MTLEITIAGGDTAQPINVAKRVNIVATRSKHLNTPRLLDCGCGTGDYLPHFSALGWHASGVEFLSDKVAAAREAGRGPEVVSQGDLQNLPFEGGSFDILLFNEVLEHVPSDRAALSEAFRVLKPGGLLFVFSPNRLYPFESHGVHLKNRSTCVPVWVPFIPYLPLRFGQKFFDYWARNYTPYELRKIVREAGFQITETSYVWQTFEGISGNQSPLLRTARPLLRSIASLLESLPGIRAFGVSQFIYAQKPHSTI